MTFEPARFPACGQWRCDPSIRCSRNKSLGAKIMIDAISRYHNRRIYSSKRLQSTVPPYSKCAQRIIRSPLNSASLAQPCYYPGVSNFCWARIYVRDLVGADPGRFRRPTEPLNDLNSQDELRRDVDTNWSISMLLWLTCAFDLIGALNKAPGIAPKGDWISRVKSQNASTLRSIDKASTSRLLSCGVSIASNFTSLPKPPPWRQQNWTVSPDRREAPGVCEGRSGIKPPAPRRTSA